MTYFPLHQTTCFFIPLVAPCKPLLPKEDIRNVVYNDPEFSAYAERIDDAFDAWMQMVDSGLRSIDEDTEVKSYIVELSEQLIGCFDGLELVDKYDVYEVLLSYWHEVMGDDVYLVSLDGYDAARTWENIMGEYTSGKKKGQEKVVGWEGVLLPKALIESVFFAAERKKIDEAQAIAEETQSRLDEFVEEQTGDEGYLKEHLNDKDKVDAKAVAARLKVLKKSDPEGDEYAALKQFADLTDSLAKQNKAVKEMNTELEEKLQAKYALLTDEEILDLLVNRKWYATIFEGIKALYVTTSHQMTNRIVELVERYEDTLPELSAAVADYESKVKAHLKRMGFVW